MGGHHTCCNQQKVKRGLWSPEEDEKLIRYISIHGYGCWSEVPEKAGLQRCGKSCRLRWINYLRPDIRRGRFTPEEEKLIISLHGVVGNRWAHIASHLPGRTDNEIKNYWNSWIKKKIRKPLVASTTPSQSVDRPHFNYNPNQLDFANQDNLTTTKPPAVQETLFSPTCPLFMFDTGSLDHGTTTTADNNSSLRTELFQDGVMSSMSSETWNLSQHHQVQGFPPAAATNFTGMDTTTTITTTTNNTHYSLPPLIDNMHVPLQLESCGIEEEGEIALECLRREELNIDWVETTDQQQCSNFLFWDDIGGEEMIAPNSSINVGANTFSSFPSTL